MSKELLIFIISREYPPYIIGGTSIVARSLAEGLQKLGNDVCVIANTTKSERHYEEINNVKVNFVPNETIYTQGTDLNNSVIKSHFKLLKAITEMILKLGVPDILIVPDLFCFPEAFIISERINRPLVNVLLQDFNTIFPYDRNRFHMVTNNVEANWEALLNLEKKSLFKSTHNVFISKSIFESIKERYPIDLNKSSVIYLGVTEEEVKISDSFDYASQRRGILPDDHVLITACGRLVPFKGFNYLIEAFSIVKKEFSNTHLNIIGAGPELEYLSMKVQELGLTEDVNFLTSLSRQKVIEYMSLTDIAVVPSLWESFCYVAAEFMALGKPIVASSVDSLNELMKNNIDALKIPVKEENGKRIIEPKDIASRICELITDKKLADKLSNNAKERAFSTFNNNIFAQKIMDLCISIIEG